MSDRFENKPVRSWTIESVYDLCSIVPYENVLAWRFPEGMPQVVADRIKRLADDQFDEGACEVNGCAAAMPLTQPDGHPAPVGFHLSGDNDEHMSWKWACVVLVPADDTRPEQAIVVCEDCDPTTLYVHQAVKA